MKIEYQGQLWEPLAAKNGEIRHKMILTDTPHGQIMRDMTPEEIKRDKRFRKNNWKMRLAQAVFDLFLHNEKP